MSILIIILATNDQSSLMRDLIAYFNHVYFQTIPVDLEYTPSKNMPHSENSRNLVIEWNDD